MAVETFLFSYGYLAVFAGVLLEGDVVLLAAGYLAERGYLDLTSVLLTAAVAASIKDHVIFGMGKLGGESMLLRKPKWYRRVKRIRRLLEFHRVWMTLAFRFLPVVAIATPLALGIGGMSRKRFVLWDLIGVGLWCCIVVLAGSGIGRTVDWLLTDGRSYEIWLLLILILLGGATWLYRVRGRGTAP